MIIWALLDGRAGNDSQVIGLANATDKPYKIIDIKYNKLSLLPNLFLRKSKIAIRNKEDLQLPYPDLVIAAGRKLASVALYIKTQNPKTKIVHIMWPEICIKDFDLIITPKHDNKKANNVINITGAIHKLTEENLKCAKIEFAHLTNDLPKPYISVLIGGSSKDKKFTKDDAKKLIKNLKLIHKKKGGSFLVTTSRRTPDYVLEMLNKLEFPKYIYTPNSKDKNPYIALLALADLIIITGDSISMCSEACYTGKPVYIYANSNFCADKHLRFHQELYNTKYAYPLDETLDLKLNNMKKLNEVEKVKNYLNLLLD